MTDSNSPNHWDLLASNLGATPPAEESEKPQAPSASQPGPAAKPAVRAPRPNQPGAPPRRTDWDVLANELGIAPAPQAAVPPPRAPTAPSVAAARAPVAPEQSRAAAVPAEAPEESPNFFDERFDFDEPFDFLESTEPRPAASAEPVVESASGVAEPTEERPRSRRSRRGRGRRGDRDSRERPAAAATGLSATEHGSTLPLAEKGEHELAAAEGEAVADATTSEASTTEQAESRRPRRRRGRRGKKRRDTETAATPAGELADESSITQSTGPADAASDQSDELAEDVEELGEGEEGDGERPARFGFRGIPTWEQAVGLLVERNLEARAKRPAGGAHHGRSNRGPRDSRGRGGQPRPSDQ